MSLPTYTDGQGITYEYDVASAPKVASVIFSSPTQATIAIPGAISPGDGNTYAVTTISEGAFSYDGTITSVSIPTSVTSIVGNPFIGCALLTAIVVDAGNTSYKSQAGVLFDAGIATLIAYPIANGDTTYAIPASVTTIGTSAFDSSQTLEGVTFAGSILTTIGDSAFSGCFQLASITLPTSVTTIGARAFSSTGITSIIIPANVTSITGNPVDNCSLLTAIVVDAGNTSYKSQDGVLFDIGITTLIAYPSGNGDTNYVIPASVTTIGSDAFNNNLSLTSIDLVNVITIGQSAFLGTGFTNVVIPASVTTINDLAFNTMPSIATITWLNPNNITTLGFSVFGSNGTFDGGSGNYTPSITGVTYNFTASENDLNGLIKTEQDLGGDANGALYGEASPLGTTPATFTYDAACFNEGTKILGLGKDLVDAYVAIEELKTGDLVKTYKHGYRRIEAIGKNTMVNTPECFNLCMYKLEKTEENGVTEDLIVTGGHSILVDDMDEEEAVENTKLFGGHSHKIDDKKLLLSAASKRFVKLENRDKYTYYHLLLENAGKDTDMFGVWANGVLTETPNKIEFMKGFSNTH